MSPYNEDNTLDSSGYQGYHRSHHRSHTQENQSEKIEVTIQGHTEESNSSQIEKKTKISLPWKHKGHILILSLILSIFSISVPCFTDFANNIQSQNLYIAKMFANGSLPYSDDRRLLLLLTSFSGFPFRINSLADSYSIPYLLSFWKLPLQDCHAHDKQEGNCHSN